MSNLSYSNSIQNNEIATYNFYVHPAVINNIYNLMIDGNKDQFLEDGARIQGAERGGHFCYKKNDDSLAIEIIGFIQAGLMPGTTSLNSGDFPFTFHTHPIVIHLDENKIDNYPNLISDEDLIGSIVDNYFYNHIDERNVCDKSGLQQTSGINFFDMVAVPYGLFIYRPIKNHDFMNKDVDTIEEDCRYIFENSIRLLPNYQVSNSMRYFDMNTLKTTNGINKYINMLRQSGFLVDFFPWSDAKNTGIQFVNELPRRSYVDDICMC